MGFALALPLISGLPAQAQVEEVQVEAEVVEEEAVVEDGTGTDGVGTDGGNPGDGLEALDTLVGVETLPIVGWIGKKKSFSSDFVH